MSFGFGVGDFIAVLDKANLYRERFADAPDHFDSLGREIASLTWILEYIGRIEDQLTEDEKKALTAPLRESTKLLGELEKIFDDNSSLERFDDTSRAASLKPRAIWRRLRMNPEDVQKLRQRITMNIHFLSAIKGFRDSEAMHATKQIVTSMHNEQTSRQEKEILDWLTTTDYAPQQRDHLSRRYTGTNQWLLDSSKYQSWVTGKSQTLLCHGMPGAGKTVMVSVVVDDLIRRYQNDSDVGIAYVYCNFKDQERQTQYDLFSSVTKQLAQCRSPIEESLKELYETHQNSGASRTVEDTKSVFQKVISSHKCVFIVIDALDECESRSRLAFLSEVFRLQTLHTTNIITTTRVNLMATTRDIPEILQSHHFNDAATLRILANDDDLSRYISGRMPGMQSFVQMRPEIQKEIQEGVLCKINGMFLLAKLLIDSLSCKTTPKGIRKALATISAEDDTYAYFYEEAMARIRVQPPDYAQLAIQVLSWIVSAQRPLNINELQHALAAEDDEPEIEEDNIPSADIIISACAGLVTLEEQGGIVRLVHQTTQEFFNKRNKHLLPEADIEITNMCVRYLCLDQVQRITSRLNQDIPEEMGPYYPEVHYNDSHYYESLVFERLSTAGIPFYAYAIQYWGYHAGRCDTLSASVAQLFRSREMLESLAFFSNELLGVVIPSAAAHLAAWLGLLPIFKSQLLSFDDISFIDDKGQTTLSLATYRRHFTLVEYILENDTLQLKNCHQRKLIDSFQAILFEAIKQDDAEVSHRLIRFALDGNVDFQSAYGPSLLDLCIEKGDVATIRLLLQRSRDGPRKTSTAPNIKGMEIEMSDAFDGTPLTFAACRGLDEVVELLLDHGANIEAVGKDGRSPLFRAAHLGHVSTVKTLQHYGAKSPVQCRGPLELWPAPKNNFWLIIELLIIGGANIESRNERGLTLLSSAARAGQLPLLVMLLDRKADIETRDGEGRTPLWHALWINQESTFEMLLRRGAKIEVVDRNGDTPLIYAARYGTASILQTLLSFGAQIEARDSQGRTPLWNAIYNRHASALETLLNRNAMIEAKDRTGRTSLSLAAEMFNPSALKTLLKYGAVVEALDKNHRTPLWYAAAAGSVACAVVLKENGADINCRDINDMTPVMKAVEEGQWPVLEELLKFGGDIGCCDKFGRTALLIGAGADCNSTLSTDDLKNKRNHGELERSHYYGDSFVASAFTPILSGRQGLSEARDSQGRTALWWAIATGNPLLSKRISEVADEVEVVDMRGRPPLLSTATKGVLYKEIAQLLLEHVCQFGPEGKRLNSQEDVTQRAIRYVTSFLQFNDIDPNTASMKDWWLGIKPGKPIEQLIA